MAYALRRPMRRRKSKNRSGAPYNAPLLFFRNEVRRSEVRRWRVLEVLDGRLTLLRTLRHLRPQRRRRSRKQSLAQRVNVCRMIASKDSHERPICNWISRQVEGELLSRQTQRFRHLILRNAQHNSRPLYFVAGTMGEDRVPAAR